MNLASLLVLAAILVLAGLAAWRAFKKGRRCAGCTGCSCDCRTGRVGSPSRPGLDESGRLGEPTLPGYLARRKTFPPRCCGSVFKNPPGDYAGRLLEAVGAKDLFVGGARVWSEHANVIYATDGCTSSDILALARLMRERVRHRLGVALEPEIRGLEF